ncbi:fluoroquinolones efflux ABC transporter permease [Salinifilum aidingensis]
MASAFAVLGRNDLRGIRREPLLIAVVLAPLGWIALLRFGTPPVAAAVHARYGLDLAPYHPLILTAFLLLTSPVVVGGLTGMLVLDERDSGTLTALRVTPVPLLRVVAYRAVTALLLTALYTVATMAASGMLPAEQLPGLAVIGLGNGLCGVMFALLVLALARNKVEGLAVMRGVAIVLAGLPLIGYFLDSPWQLALGVIPTYWPAQAYWTLSEGGQWWPHVLGGLAVNGVLALLLYRRFARSV